MRTPDFTTNILTLVVDEGHCISQWGNLFRKKYSELGQLRVLVPTSVPFLITSATLPLHFTLIGRKAKRERLTVKAWTRRHEPGYLDWSGPIVHPEGANELYF
jgi:hypothetical protein